MTIFWKDINLILNPDPELTRLPPVVIPQCQKDLFKRTCEKVWAEQVILPWLQKKMQGTGITQINFYHVFSSFPK